MFFGHSLLVTTEAMLQLVLLSSFFFCGNNEVKLENMHEWVMEVSEMKAYLLAVLDSEQLHLSSEEIGIAA